MVAQLEKRSHCGKVWHTNGHATTRALLLGARVSIEAAPKVAELMARELKRDGDWQKQTVRNFKQLAQGYLLPAMSTDDTSWALRPN